MPTNTVIITDAYQETQIVADGQTASASELADGLTELNQMMAMWAENDMDVGYFPQDTGSDTCPIPKWAEQAVKSNLAMNLCVIFGKDPKMGTALRASEGADFIAKKCINNKLEGVDMDHMPQGRSTSRYNITTDS